MILSKEYRPERLCGADPTRSVLADPWLDLTDPAKPVLVSTNGYALIAIKVEATDGDCAGPVPIAAIAASRKTFPKGFVGLTAETATVAGVAYPRWPSGDVKDRPTFPNWRNSAVPDAKRGEVQIAVDLALFAEMHKAAGAPEWVKLCFDPADIQHGPIRVVPAEYTDVAIALVMPCGADEPLPTYDGAAALVNAREAQEKALADKRSLQCELDRVTGALQGELSTVAKLKARVNELCGEINALRSGAGKLALVPAPEPTEAPCDNDACAAAAREKTLRKILDEIAEISDAVNVEDKDLPEHIRQLAEKADDCDEARDEANEATETAQREAAQELAFSAPDRKRPGRCDSCGGALNENGHLPRCIFSKENRV